MESLGSLEEVVLIILVKYDKCHGVEILDRYRETLKKGISLPALHVVLKRMEKKGWVKSEFGEPTAERGGRRKRMYWATRSGYEIVKEVQEAKMGLWKSIVKPAFEYAKV